MRLRIISTDFTKENEWLFKLCDEDGNEYFIMNDSFYKKHNLKSPITKKELDYFDRGQWINAHIDDFNGKRVVIRFG